jgi:chromosome segregation ATPase
MRAHPRLTLLGVDARVHFLSIPLIRKPLFWYPTFFVDSHLNVINCFQHDGARAELTAAQNQMESIKEQIKAKDTYIMELQEKIEKHHSEANEARKVEQECLKQEESLIPLEQAARQKVAEIKTTRDSEKNQGTVLKAILQAKESKEIEGIYGRLGDLGAIDAKYDVAISTACPGLDYIVVETTNSAQACVELLRRRNLGIATFMILVKFWILFIAFSCLFV